MKIEYTLIAGSRLRYPPLDLDRLFEHGSLVAYPRVCWFKRTLIWFRDLGKIGGELPPARIQG
jgi:hypothetical protein